MTKQIARPASPEHKFTYRPEIDGLRALAIIPVLLFHAGITGFQGGFVGVDIFFVISGYLISAILFKEITSGAFSIYKFYERRVRRIFPALILVFIVCTVIASLLLMPQDFRRYARSVMASGLFSSNLLFWWEGGYFDSSSELKPLLHTWSLSVEEQFYIVFPGLLLLLLRHVKRWRQILFTLAALSFITSVIVTKSNPSAAFYWPVSRAWELLLGSFIALSIGFRDIERSSVRNLMSSFGIILIAVSIFAFDNKTPFPGFAAGLPALGAALVVAYSSGTITGTVLTCKPVVWVGKLSYSLYLWHWPIIVFGKYYLMREFTETEKILVIAASFFASYVSMRFIEAPIRDRKWFANTAQLMRLSAVSVALLIASNFAIYIGNGVPARLPASVQQFAAGARDVNPRRAECDGRSVAEIVKGHVCLVGAGEDSPSFAILGDSFGDALLPGISEAATEAGRRGIVLTSSGCYPLAGLDDMNKRGDSSCKDFVDAAITLLKNKRSITNVVLIGRWTSAALGTRFGETVDDGWFVKDINSKSTSYGENRRVFERSVRRTVDLLAEKRVFIVSYIPEQRIDPPRALGLCTYLGRECPAGIRTADFETRQAFIRNTLDALATDRRIHVIDVGSKLCSNQRCKIVANGHVLYADDNHLSKAGALFIKDLFTPIFIAPVRKDSFRSDNTISKEIEKPVASY